MSSARELTYFGVCVRLRNGSAYLEVRGQSDGDSIRDLSHSSHNMFPPQGEVELRANPATPVSRGDWMAFGVESFGPPGHTKFRTVEACRLLPFEDLTDIGDAESIRCLLVEDGRAEDFPGSRYVRIGEREMVRIDAEQGRDGRWRVSHETDLSALPVWEYRPELRLAMNDGARAVIVVDTRTAFRQIGATNWSSDAEVIRRIIGGMRAKTDSDDSARRQFAGAMLRYAEQLERGTESSDWRAGSLCRPQDPPLSARGVGVARNTGRPSGVLRLLARRPRRKGTDRAKNRSRCSGGSCIPTGFNRTIAGVSNWIGRWPISEPGGNPSWRSRSRNSAPK